MITLFIMVGRMWYLCLVWHIVTTAKFSLRYGIFINHLSYCCKGGINLRSISQAFLSLEKRSQT